MWKYMLGTDIKLGAKTLRSLSSAVLLCSVLCFAPRASEAHNQLSPSFVDSGTVTLTTGGGVFDLDPASVVAAAANVMITANIDETLVTYKGPSVNDFVPLLATSWSANPARSVWTFHLRTGVKYHTGRCCMTSDDVKYNIARTITANLAGAYIFGRYMTDPMKQIKVIDAHTIEFDLGVPQYTFINAIASKNAGLILDPVAIKAHTTKTDPWAHNWVTSHDAGTGPYVLTIWQRSIQETLTAFPGYWGGWAGPHFSKILMREIPETTTRRELLEKGQADLTFALTPQDNAALASNPAVKVVKSPSTEIDYIAMNESGPLSNPLARQALAYAFNYAAYLQASSLNQAKRGYGLLASTLAGFDPHIFKYSLDLNKAKTLLQQAGVAPGTTFSYVFVTGYPAEKLAGQILQAELAQINYKVALQGVTQQAQGAIYFGTSPASKRPNLMNYAWWPDYNDPYDESVVLVAKNGGANIGLYSNKTVDALLADMKQAEPAKLIADAKQVQEITTHTDPAAIWLAEPGQVNIVASSLKGYVFNPLDVQVYSFYPMYR